METYKCHFGHNGNIPENLPLLRKKAGDHSKQISDTSLMATLIMKERMTSDSWEEALVKVLLMFKGAFCNIILTNEPSIYAMRDPFGIRPLCLGKFEDGWIIASESVRSWIQREQNLSEILCQVK